MSEDDKKIIYYRLREYCIDRRFTKEQTKTFFECIYLFMNFYHNAPEGMEFEDVAKAFKEGYERAKNT